MALVATVDARWGQHVLAELSVNTKVVVELAVRPGRVPKGRSKHTAALIVAAAALQVDRVLAEKLILRLHEEPTVAVDVLQVDRVPVSKLL